MNEFVFTAAGQQLVSRMIAGEATAAFTRVETSDHEYTKNGVEMLTALADVKQEVLISKVTRVDPAKVELLIALDNREVKETYNVKAIGVYARDSDQQEILFGVAVNTDTPDPMPVLAGKTISELTYHLVLAVAVSDQIDISVNPSAGATVEQLEELEGDVNAKVEQLLEKTRLLQDELEDVQNELRSVVKQTAIVNNNTTTEAGFALDARQANQNIEGTLAANILKLNNDLSDLSGSLNSTVVFNQDSVQITKISPHAYILHIDKLISINEAFTEIDLGDIPISCADITANIVTQNGDAVMLTVTNSKLKINTLTSSYKGDTYIRCTIVISD